MAGKKARLEARTVLLFGILSAGIIIGILWIPTQEKPEESLISEMKRCSSDSDCVIVGTIRGLDHIPLANESGCLCVTSINRKYIGLWEQKREEAEANYTETMIICKPCVFTYENSRAKCENFSCEIGMK